MIHSLLSILKLTNALSSMNMYEFLFYNREYNIGGEFTHFSEAKPTKNSLQLFHLCERRCPQVS